MWCPLSPRFLREKPRQAETESRPLGLSRRPAVARPGPRGKPGCLDGRRRARAQEGHVPKPDPPLDASRPSPFWEKQATGDGAQAAESRDARRRVRPEFRNLSGVFISKATGFPAPPDCRGVYGDRVLQGRERSAQLATSRPGPFALGLTQAPTGPRAARAQGLRS